MTELPPLKGTRFTTIRLVPETGSTNADLLAAAAWGEPEGSVLVTDHQTAGRGRQQRRWHDDPGNALLVSFLVRPPMEVAGLMPLAAGLAVVGAIESLDGRSTPGGAAPLVGLKWPNDVLAPRLAERKLAGLLTESTTGGAGTDRLAVVVGMGLNLRWANPPPPEIAARASTLEELLGRPIARHDVLEAYLRHVEGRLGQLEAGDAPALLDAYRTHCLTLGREVRFTTAAADYRGTALDITPRGLLVLESADGSRIELAAGDAHHVDGE